MKKTTVQIIRALAITGAIAACVPLMAQQPYPQQPYPSGYPAPYSGTAPVFAPQQLDGLVSQIALYPDPLLGQVLTAATFPIRFRRPRAGRTLTAI